MTDRITLHFSPPRGFNLSEPIYSGITDDTGTTHTFSGVAMIEEITIDRNADWPSPEQQHVYVRIYPSIS